MGGVKGTEGIGMNVLCEGAKFKIIVRNENKGNGILVETLDAHTHSSPC